MWYYLAYVFGVLITGWLDTERHKPTRQKCVICLTWPISIPLIFLLGSLLLDD